MSDQVPIPQLVSPSVNEIFRTSPRTGESEADGKVPSYSKMDKNLEDIHSFLQDDSTREQFMQFAEV
jgi:hypothetical protein